jgi:Mg2+ and Co2+ transporter CorA
MHYDSITNIDLAHAAERNSSSMETIAVMTILFLPATFFAALFAIPSLRWDQPVVIQDRYWVYWAFTVPTTALIFVAWISITKRSWILNKIRQKRV